jgi:hypothetical protein
VHVELKLAAGFRESSYFPRRCGAGTSCALGDLGPGDSSRFTVLGSFTKPGAFAFSATASSAGLELSPDSHPNTLSAKVTVLGVPKPFVDLTTVAGRSVTVQGRAVAGSTFQPSLERVARVDVAIQRVGATGAPAWRRALGTARWTFRTKLPPGAYVATARATNAGGVVGTSTPKKIVVK